MSAGYVGVYWASRKEARESCAERVAHFLIRLEALDKDFSRWFRKGARRAKDGDVIYASTEAVANYLTTNNRDMDAKPIEELGFRFAAWNGCSGPQAVSISVTCGAFSGAIKNSVVVSFDPAAQVSASLAKALLDIAVDVFDPDTGRASFRNVDSGIEEFTYKSA